MIVSYSQLRTALSNIKQMSWDNFSADHILVATALHENPFSFSDAEKRLIVDTEPGVLVDMIVGSLPDIVTEASILKTIDDIAWQLQAFGETAAQMKAAKPSGLNSTFYAQMILSDAQECIARGMNETARQYINKAKFFISEGMK